MSALRREEKPAAVEERGGAVTRRPNSRLGDSKSSNNKKFVLEPKSITKLSVSA